MAQAPFDENAFESRLTDGTDRFISHMIEHAFAIGRRNSRDFLRHFPPSTIMEALRDSPSLRADILESATGVKRKVALKKSAGSSGEDLQIALEEGEAAADDVVQLFRPDDRVRYLPRARLWSFLIEGEFWKANKGEKGSYERAQQHIAYLLDRALKDQVISHQDIIEGISISKISQLMPRPELEIAMNSALSFGRKGQPFSDRDLYDSLTSITIANYIPLTHIWEEVVHPFIAVEHGLVDNGNTARADKGAAADEAGRPAVANSNDLPAGVPTPAKPTVVAKPVNPAALPKRAPTAATPIAMPVKPAATPVAAAVKAPLPAAVEAIPVSGDEEDGAFDVHFENLTASKG